MGWTGGQARYFRAVIACHTRSQYNKHKICILPRLQGEKLDQKHTKVENKMKQYLQLKGRMEGIYQLCPYCSKETLEDFKLVYDDLNYNYEEYRNSPPEARWHHQHKGNGIHMHVCNHPTLVEGRKLGNNHIEENTSIRVDR